MHVKRLKFQIDGLRLHVTSPLDQLYAKNHQPLEIFNSFDGGTGGFQKC